MRRWLAAELLVAGDAQASVRSATGTGASFFSER